VLARLDQIDNVVKSYANHTGTMLKVELVSESTTAIVEAISDELSPEDRKPTFLTGEDYETALRDERWRDARGIRILSLIEYTTLAARWVSKPGVFLPTLMVVAAALYWRRRQRRPNAPAAEPQ